MEKSGALILILLICVPFLSGCIQAKTTFVNSYQSTLALSREIRVEDAQTAEVYQQITDPQGIKNFLDQLQLEEWILATLLLYGEGPYAAMQVQGTSVVFEMPKAGCDALTKH